MQRRSILSDVTLWKVHREATTDVKVSWSARVPPAWVGDTIAATLIVLVAFAPLPVSSYPPEHWLEHVLVASPALVLPLRRRVPLIVLTLTSVIYVAACALGVLSPGAVLATAIATFNYSTATSRQQSLTATTITLIVVYAGAQSVTGAGFLDPRAVQFAIAIAFAGALGDSTRLGRMFAQAAVARAERAERTREAEARRRVTEERLQIARNLHDAVAHQISVVSLNAGLASSTLRSDPDESERALRTIREASRSMLGEIGSLLQLLRSDEDEMQRNASYRIADLPSLIDRFRSHGLDVSSRIDDVDSDATPQLTSTIYWVVQEGLTNAQKHGSGDRAQLHITQIPGAVYVRITNPTRGIAPERASVSTGGYGLRGLTERAHLLGGSVSTSADGGLFTLIVHLPHATKEPSS